MGFRLEDEDDDDKGRLPDMPMSAGPVQNALFKSRTVLIFGEIDMRLAERVSAQLLALASDGKGDIKVFVNSPGGHVESGDTVHDMIRYCGPQVKVIGTGWVASAGAHIFLGATKENRFCLPNTRFLLHEPRGGVGGQATDVEIQAREIIKMRERLNKIFAAATGKSLEQIKEDTDRDFWMSAEEAVKYGLVGKVVNHRSDVN
ncbi:ATP-dependent Clp protease proteolytic subunit [Hyphomonas sp. UBA4508]|uniref:ATP-dependent Clp protease proteolytic subunit n=1 Tax=Hyphomonas sp. UBA4508 TaxID=1946633 RepID=UPI0025C627CA|nr:ATP-dependent Clp protease proteolytic subunit [Hyphomonas sp. UBA4508]